MNQISQPVYPNISIQKKIVRMTIEPIELRLFESLSMSVLFFDMDDKLVDAKKMVLDQTNGYSEWGSDDKFIITWIKQQLSIGLYT
jgi:hypothetical protein